MPPKRSKSRSRKGASSAKKKSTPKRGAKSPRRSRGSSKRRGASASASPNLSPFNSPIQNAAATKQEYGAVPDNCVVTGGTGFVGQRLVEMLVERGAKRVVSFDVVPLDEDKRWNHPAIEYVLGDITDPAAVDAACEGADCVWHNAAAVGPFHPHELYDRVNHIGTLHVIEACKKHGVRKIVMSSSPSTRFDGSDIDGLTEDELPSIPMKSYLQAYAASKAAGEKALTDACSDELMTIAVAPHQVYGPRDNLFLPNILEAHGSGVLRIFASSRTGYGMNRVCFTHVDNYCHGLIIAEQALYPGSAALGKFYIVTDGDTHPYTEGYAHFWKTVDRIGMSMGFTSLWSMMKLPDWFLYPIAYICKGVTALTGKQVKLNPFNVAVLTMHRWFKIGAAERDLNFQPIVGYEEGVEDTCSWFKENWFPDYLRRKNATNSDITSYGIAQQSMRKIDIQAESSRAVERKRTGAQGRKKRGGRSKSRARK